MEEKKEFKGELQGFPEEVVEWMLDQQEAQGNKRDVSVFESSNYSTKGVGGFDWDVFGDIDFCHKVIYCKNFDLFFEHYPKKPKCTGFDPMEEQVMMVWDDESDKYKRVVFGKKNGKFLAWCTAETIEDAKSETNPLLWSFADPIPETPTLTKQQICEKFGIDDFKLID